MDEGQRIEPDALSSSSPLYGLRDRLDSDIRPQVHGDYRSVVGRVIVAHDTGVQFSVVPPNKEGGFMPMATR